jgi:K+-sensing histidine kinase KdpD
MEFSSPSDQITLQLNLINGNEHYQLKVINTGSQIPLENSHQLFDSLTSFRPKKGPEPHLGLGLYIAKLICDYHQSSITANNIKAPIAVEFVVTGALTQAK